MKAQRRRIRLPITSVADLIENAENIHEGAGVFLETKRAEVLEYVAKKGRKRPAACWYCLVSNHRFDFWIVTTSQKVIPYISEDILAEDFKEVRRVEGRPLYAARVKL